MKNISLYIHIPFCKSKCFYCDFLSYAHLETQIEPYIEALLAEIRSYSQQTKDYIVKSIFFGGGTPSLIPSKYIHEIMSTINEQFNMEEMAEITIEANPESLTDEKMNVYKGSGINRISLGLQATQNERLKQIGRIHDYETFLKQYHKLRRIGYHNINVDLMFGLPGQTLEEWHETLCKVIELQPEHISVYGLLIEEGTPFHTQYQAKEWILPDEDQEREMYWHANQLLKDNGYQHYEISNYSKIDRACKHNIVYWTLEEYIGMGLGASSYFQGNRTENTDKMDVYIRAKGNLKQIIRTSEKTSIKAQMEEWVFLGLRLIGGININDFKQKFGKDIETVYGDVIIKLISEGLLFKKDNQLRLTDKGIDISNMVFSQFLLD